MNAAMSTRAQEIERLIQRYEFYNKHGKRKAAAEVYAKLLSLRTRQLRAEMRQERRKAA